ncbi:MAG: thiolase family protein [Actinomycetota bacterium]
MSDKVAVLGAGVTLFERQATRRLDEMASEAVSLALRDAGLSYGDIEVAFVANAYRSGSAPIVFYKLSRTGIPITHIDIACASGTRSVQLAGHLIASGAYQTCLVVGVEMMPGGMVPWPIDPEAVSLYHEMMFDTVTGLLTMPGAYAYKAVRYMHDFGATPEQFAHVAVKNHRNSCLNPNAMYRKEFSIEEVLGSRMICYPLTLFQCCANSNGAAAVVLSSESLARRHTSQPVLLSGWGETSMRFDPVDPVESHLSEGDTVAAAAGAYEMSGAGPGDADLAQVHDAFSAAEVLQIEALGLCGKGEGAAFTAAGNTEIGGRIPVNTDGGLMGCGHPVGASGCRMVAEVCSQLKGQAGARQVEGARLGLVQNSGLGASNVLVLER